MNARVKLSCAATRPLISIWALLVLCRVLGKFGIIGLAARFLPGLSVLA
jgi:hypothetical protein